MLSPRTIEICKKLVNQAEHIAGCVDDGVSPELRELWRARDELNALEHPAPVAQTEPDWNNAPSWAMWWAMDKDGESYWYEKEPVERSKSWDNISGSLYEREERETLAWRTLKQRRPTDSEGGE